MGIFDALKKVGVASKKAIDRMSKEVKYRRKLKEVKVELLLRFKFSQLQKICAIKGISDTKLEGDALSGYKKIKIRSKKELAEKLSSLSWSELKKFAKRFKVAYSDLEKELIEYKKMLFEEVKEKEKSPRTKELLSESEAEFYLVEEKYIDLPPLLDDFEPEPIINEEDLEKQLYQYLVAKLGRDRVRRQVAMERGKIDIIIDDNVGVEIKIAKRKEDLNMLLGQAMVYKDHLDKLYTVILDIGKNVELSYYKDRLEKIGVDVLIFRGSIRSIRGRKKIVIKL